MENGVDITPLYRAAAKGQMLQGGALVAGGIVISLVGSGAGQVIGLVLIGAGLVRVILGLVQYAKYS